MYHVGPHEFTATDVRRTLSSLGGLWRHYVHDLPFVPPAAVDAATTVADRLEHLTATNENRDRDGDGDDVADRLDRSGRAAADLIGAGSWDDDTIVTEVDLAWNGIRQVGVALREAGIFESGPPGRVAQLNLSDGGVPKTPAPSGEVNWHGLVGDSQHARQHHGRPWQALSLWSSEVIAAFAALGHPIHAGATGENITIEGLEWETVRPGVRLTIGDVRCEVSAYAIPCSKNARWFLDERFDLMHHDNGPVSRLYATVLEPGRIETGDDVVLEP